MDVKSLFEGRMVDVKTESQIQSGICKVFLASSQTTKFGKNSVARFKSSHELCLLSVDVKSGCERRTVVVKTESQIQSGISKVFLASLTNYEVWLRQCGTIQ